MTVDDTIKMYDIACREYILKTCGVTREFLDKAFPLKNVTSAGLGIHNEKFTIETALEHYAIKSFCIKVGVKISKILMMLRLSDDEHNIIIAWKALFNRFIKQIKPNKTSKQSTEASLEQIGALFAKVYELSEEEQSYYYDFNDTLI